MADHQVKGLPLPITAFGALHTEGIPVGVWLTGAPVKWAQGVDGAGAVVGVLDSGIDDTHPDLQQCPDGRPKVIGRRDYIGDGVHPWEFHSHGTHVAGTIAANGGIKGVAPGAQLRDYRVLGQTGWGEDAGVTQAIRDAADDGCHIISMSLGSPEDYPPMHDAVLYAIGRGCLVLVAVGNEGSGQKSYPGYYPEVVGVAAIGYDYETGKIRWQWFSCTNNEVDVCANGADVLSCYPGGLYSVSTGTSMATPHVAGVAALNIQQGAMRTGERLTEPVQWYGLKALQTVDVEDIGIDARTGAGAACLLGALPKCRQVANTTNEFTRTVDGVADAVDAAPLMLPTPGKLGEHRTYTPPRHTHGPMHDQFTWVEGPAAPDGTPTGTLTLSRWLIPGMETGQPKPPEPRTEPLL